MVYSTEVEHQCPLMKGCNHGPAPLPEEGKWVQAKQIKDISGYTHGVGPQPLSSLACWELGFQHLPGALCSGTGSPALGLCSP